jgi:predicted TPR repeat methyltransferase
VAQYDFLAKFYDDVIGRNGLPDYRIVSLMKKYAGKAGNVLELGCGTASNLVALSKNYRVTGIDRSPQMLKIAKSKLPDSDFIEADITEFRSDFKYDAIICMYDTVNHLPEFDLWKKLFFNVSSNLSANGIFIFDVNTLDKLNYMTEIDLFTHRFGDNYLIMDVTKSGKDIYSWDAKIFEKNEAGNYTLHNEVFIEAGFKKEKIVKELEKNFEIIQMIDEMEGNDVPFRTYFICRKLN